MPDLPYSGLFVVRQEGGQYEWLDKATWDRTRRNFPIYGVKVGDLFIGRDKIAKRYIKDDLWMRVGFTWSGSRA